MRISDWSSDVCSSDLYLEGWVDQGPGAFPGLTARTRAFGARCVHVIAGNAPIVSILTVIRNALTRSDAIIKLPSNDPLTTVALVRPMVEMAPDHPIKIGRASGRERVC